MQNATIRLLHGAGAALALLLLPGCRETPTPTELEGPARPAFASASRDAVEFVIGPLVPVISDLRRPGGRFHMNDVVLPGPVSGDIEGEFEAVVDLRMDSGFTGRGHGTATLTTAESVWEGSVVVEMVGVFDDAVGRPLPLASLQMVLHGSDEQTLMAECQERMPPSSETLDCSGRIDSPHGSMAP